MGQHTHKLEIFRGLIKFKSNVQKIWGVLIFLSIVTAIEVALGIVKPEILMSSFLSLKLINWIFLILTIVKAYNITWDFMHMRDEKINQCPNFPKYLYYFSNCLFSIYSFS